MMPLELVVETSATGEVCPVRSYEARSHHDHRARRRADWLYGPAPAACALLGGLLLAASLLGET